MRPDFSLHLPDPRLRAGVTFESWNPFTSGADPLHPGWYGDPTEWASEALAGLMLGPDAAMRVSVVNRCVTLRANMMASLPCKLYQLSQDDEKEQRRDHPAHYTVRRKPNQWQTRFQFFRDMQATHDLHGLAFARVSSAFTGAKRRITMTPLDPRCVRVTTTGNGEVRYVYEPPMGDPVTILQEDMLYLRDIAPDFLTGQARAALAREAIAVSRAAEQMVARFFENDAGGRLSFKHPGKFETPAKRDEFMAYLKREVMGAKNARRPILAYGGVEVESIDGPNDTDFLVDPRTFQAADIARFWGCPGVMIGLEEKTSSWGTGVWEIKQGFIDFTLKPEVINWQESLEQALLDDDEREAGYYFEFEFGALLQANPVEQANANQIYIQTGVLSPDEVRATTLNRNKRPDGQGGVYQQNVPGAAPNQQPEEPEDDPEEPEPEDEPEATPIQQAGRVPRPLVADAAERIASAIGRGTVEKRAEYVTRALRPWVEAFDISPVVVMAAVERIEVIHAAALEDRRGLVAGILEELLTPAAGRKVAA